MVNLVEVKPGDAAPDFTLHDQDGRPVTLSSYRGKNSVVLYFYPKDFSPGCMAQACGFRDAYVFYSLTGGEAPMDARVSSSLFLVLCLWAGYLLINGLYLPAVLGLAEARLLHREYV